MLFFPGNTALLLKCSLQLRFSIFMHSSLYDLSVKIQKWSRYKHGCWQRSPLWTNSCIAQLQQLYSVHAVIHRHTTLNSIHQTKTACCIIPALLQNKARCRGALAGRRGSISLSKFRSLLPYRDQVRRSFSFPFFHLLSSQVLISP